MVVDVLSLHLQSAPELPRFLQKVPASHRLLSDVAGSFCLSIHWTTDIVEFELRLYLLEGSIGVEEQ